MLLFFTELNTKSESDHPVTLFLRGSKPHAALADNSGSDDEEKGVGSTQGGGFTDLQGNNDRGLAEIPSSVTADPDIFSWRNVSYTVPISGGTRKLLDNVSGYVAPGKLTALMGESGAGKVRF